MRSKRDIQPALEKNLSCLEMTAAQRAAIREKIRGGEKVKRKMPVALVLALLMVLLTATAWAVGNWEQVKNYLETVRFIQGEHGGRWQLKDQLALVEAMHAAGLDMDEGAYQRLQQAGLSQQDQEAICQQIIASRYGENWKTVDIEEFEWPTAQRFASLEALREYDAWSDAVQAKWEAAHPKPTEPLTEAQIRSQFKDCLVDWLNYDPDTLQEEHITAVFHEADQWWECAYPPALTMTCNAWGGDVTFRSLPMAEEMVRNMCSFLTEVKGFAAESIDTGRIQVQYLSDQRLWEASYILTAQNPGMLEQTLAEKEAGAAPMTMMDFMAQAYGGQDSYTFRCCYDDLNRFRPQGEENRAVLQQNPPVDEVAAENTAKAALMEQYALSQADLARMPMQIRLYANEDGTSEYYLEFLGNEYSENLVRLWAYAARVDAQSGALLAAIRREDWNPVTGRRLTEDANDFVAQSVWVDKMRRALNGVVGDTGDSSDGYQLLYDAEGRYFYAWPLEEKAAFSARYKPLVDAFLSENPDIARYWQDTPDKPSYYNCTRRLYGLPDAQALSQEKALALSQDAAIRQLGATQKILDSLRETDVYYDITDPQRPLWKFHFARHTANLGAEDALGYFVCLDAYTGEVVTCFARTISTEMLDLM